MIRTHGHGENLTDYGSRKQSIHSGSLAAACYCLALKWPEWAG